MDLLHTDPHRFADLVGFPFEPHDVTVSAPAEGAPEPVRMSCVDEGPRDGPVVVLLHGQPTWSFLYRRMIPPLVEAGVRVVAPDLVGFGRSEKPTNIADHSYARHVAWTWALVDALDLDDMVWFGQDWGGLIGLRLLAAHPERFAMFVAANTALPDGDQQMPEVWHRFRRAVNTAEHLDIARFVQSGTKRHLSAEELAAYDAPFPDEALKAGPRAMPELVPYHPDHPAADDNRRAWARIRELDVPIVTAFSDGDPIMAGVDRIMQRAFAGAQGQPHTTITGAGHFLQEDKPDDLAAFLTDLIVPA
jgi:haloalkane dehalogenase